jgi:hypothetical protein
MHFTDPLILYCNTYIDQGREINILSFLATDERYNIIYLLHGQIRLYLFPHYVSGYYISSFRN